MVLKNNEKKEVVIFHWCVNWQARSKWLHPTTAVKDCQCNVPLLQYDKNITVTRPSILCVTQKRAFMPLYIGYWVSKGLVCLYILEKVEIWSGDTDAWHTDSQTTEDRNGQTNQPNVFPPQIIHTPDFLDECKFWTYVRTSPHKFCICNQTSSTVKVRLPIHAPHLTLPRQLYLNKNIWAK